MHLPLVDRLEHLLFWRQTVGVTGDGPYEARAIEKIVTLEGGVVGGRDIWQPSQLVVIGREGFDPEYLQSSVSILKTEKKTPCEYISQEDFWDAWLYRSDSRYKPYIRGDSRIKNHLGLAYLTSIGFAWPTTGATGSAGHGTNSLSERLNDIHDIRRSFGYEAGNGTVAEERRQKLFRAIKPPPFGLGLRSVVDHITGLIRMNGLKAQPPTIAISNWQGDLEWLRKEHYEGSVASFVWPNIDMPDTLREAIAERDLYEQ